jgi:hypothetical protein
MNDFQGEQAAIKKFAAQEVQVVLRVSHILLAYGDVETINR